MAKKKVVEPIPLVDANGDTKTINLGSIEELQTSRTLSYTDWNMVLVHRHYDPLFQRWGNFCSRMVTKITVRADNEKPIRWYHRFLFDFCYDQYDRYGDYYRVLDNSFGDKEDDELLEVR